ncbi:MAG TPA: class I SAM-dependent methyltransferase [Coleofasciculaceae cyanobacterium]
MTTAVNPSSRLTSQLVNWVLSIKPVFHLAKHQARRMMKKRAASIGVDWIQEVALLCSREGTEEFSSEWIAELAQIQNNQLQYPDYYLRPFHAYEQGNLSWEAAMEVEVAAHAVHARLWPDAPGQGSTRLRQNYITALNSQLSSAPQAIVDLGCSVGMTTFALQEAYPHAQITGVDLSPYFLAIARYRSQQRQANVNWIHAAAESTGLPTASFDLVSVFLVFHELPQSAAIAVLHEARRLLRPEGYLAITDVNPHSPTHAKMPPYILTLLKSTEPYIDEYFALDLEKAIVEAGFTAPTLTSISPPHRTLIARAV